MCDGCTRDILGNETSLKGNCKAGGVSELNFFRRLSNSVSALTFGALQKSPSTDSVSSTKSEPACTRYPFSTITSMDSGSIDKTTMAAPIFGEMNTSNETPLMFSRSSSLGSLSSLEQQVPSEDHGYNASDFRWDTTSC